MTDVAAEKIEKIRDILWPCGDQDAEWDSDTLDAIARVLREEKAPALAPEEEYRFCRIDVYLRAPNGREAYTRLCDALEALGADWDTEGGYYCVGNSAEKNPVSDLWGVPSEDSPEPPTTKTEG